MDPSPGTSPPPRPAVDAARLWTGGLATAVVAALLTTVGVLVAEGLLDVDMAEPPLLPIGESFPVRYAVTAAVLALAATGLAHLLALTAPRPRTFLSWIVGLVTVVGTVLPLAADGPLGGRLATALVDLAVGLCVLGLLRSVLARTVTVRGPLPGRYPGPRSYG